MSGPDPARSPATWLRPGPGCSPSSCTKAAPRGCGSSFADDPVTVVPAGVRDLRLPHRPFRVVANPPFAHGAALIRALFHPGSRLIQADLVLPVQVAQRWSGRLGKAHHGRVVRRLPSRAFHPAAPVPTAVLRIHRR